MIYIDKVKKDSYYGCDVITHVHYNYDLNLLPGSWCTKQEMIEYMNSHPYVTVMTKYYRNGRYFIGEKVRVIDNEYLRTDANYIKADNLGEL